MKILVYLLWILVIIAGPLIRDQGIFKNSYGLGFVVGNISLLLLQIASNL